jgi:hypothetical protein
MPAMTADSRVRWKNAKLCKKQQTQIAKYTDLHDSNSEYKNEVYEYICDEMT